MLIAYLSFLRKYVPGLESQSVLYIRYLRTNYTINLIITGIDSD
jgi:hypothetical protein